jgi:hypothetical protein
MQGRLKTLLLGGCIAVGIAALLLACGWLLMPDAHSNAISPALRQFAKRATPDQRLEIISLVAARRANYLSYKQAIVGAWSTILGFATLGAAAVAALYAKASASQAKRSADIAQAAFAAGERAWINIEMQAIENFYVSRDGGLGAMVALKITNIGKTPALNAHTFVDMILDYREAPNALAELSERNLYADQKSSRMVLPQQSYTRKWGPSCHPNDVAKQGHGLLLPVIIGCVTYQTLPDNKLHQTAFAFSLSVRDENGEGSGLISTENPPPANMIVADWTTGGFAT